MRKLTAKQEKILAYISDFTRKMGYPPTVREIGKRFRIASSSVFDHLNALEAKGVLKRKGEGKSRTLVLTKKSETLPQALVHTERVKTISVFGDSEFPYDERIETVQIPLLGRVAAGKPLLAVENIEEMISLPKNWIRSSQVFALRITGDSMVDDGIHDGDCVMVKTQPTANNGDIVVALLEDEATVKRFYKRGHSVCLRSANIKYADILTRNVKILGRVIGLFRAYAH